MVFYKYSISSLQALMLRSCINILIFSIFEVNNLKLQLFLRFFKINFYYFLKLKNTVYYFLKFIRVENNANMNLIPENFFMSRIVC